MDCFQHKLNYEYATNNKEIELLHLLEDGCNIASAVRKLSLNYGRARTFAIKCGWTKKMRNSFKYKNHKSSKNFKNTKCKLTTNNILELYDSGISYVDIAKKAGCTRQWICKIVKSSGRIGIREKNKAKRALNDERERKIKSIEKQCNEIIKVMNALNKELKLFNDWKEVREWWHQGIPLKEIANRLNMSMQSLSWYIGKFRKEYGWFLPLRKKHTKKIP